MNKKLMIILEELYVDSLKKVMPREKRIHMVASYIMTVLVNILPDELKDVPPSILMPAILKECANISAKGITETNKWECNHE